MKSSGIALALSVLVLISGCLPVVSLYPLYRQSDLVFDQSLLGRWAEDVNSPDPTWQFSRIQDTSQVLLPEPLKEASDKLYELRLTDQKGHTGLFVACLVKLDCGSFLDVSPAQFPSGQTDPDQMALTYNAFFFVPGHTFMKVDAAGSEVRVSTTDDESLKQLLDERPTSVSHADPDDRLILTATTVDLQAFVRKYVKDSRLFSKQMTLRPMPSRAGQSGQPTAPSK